jgi:hypothetical protein
LWLHQNPSLPCYAGELSWIKGKETYNLSADFVPFFLGPPDPAESFRHKLPQSRRHLKRQKEGEENTETSTYGANAVYFTHIISLNLHSLFARQGAPPPAFFFFFAILGINPRALHLLSDCCTTSAAPPALLFLF